MWEQIKTNPILYLTGGALTASAALALCILFGVLTGIPAESMGIAAAGVVLATFHYGATHFTAWALRLAPRVSLDRPIKRALFLQCPLGLVLLVCSWLVFPGERLGYWADRVFVSPAQVTYYSGNTFAFVSLAWIGIALVASGLLTGVLYDSTVGRLVRWVRGDGASK